MKERSCHYQSDRVVRDETRRDEVGTSRFEDGSLIDADGLTVLRCVTLVPATRHRVAR